MSTDQSSHLVQIVNLENLCGQKDGDSGGAGRTVDEGKGAVSAKW